METISGLEHAGLWDYDKKYYSQSVTQAKGKKKLEYSAVKTMFHNLGLVV